MLKSPLPQQQVFSSETEGPTLLTQALPGKSIYRRRLTELTVILLCLLGIGALVFSNKQIFQSSGFQTLETAGVSPKLSPSPPAAEAPIPAAPLTPKPVDRVAQESNLQPQVAERLEQWAGFWQARQPEPYLALFSSEFPDWARYRENRRSRITSATFIELRLDDLVFRQTGPDEIVVRFRQTYRSDTHSSQQMKELTWRQTPEGPKIVRERMIN